MLWSLICRRTRDESNLQERWRELSGTSRGNLGSSKGNPNESPGSNAQRRPKHDIALERNPSSFIHSGHFYSAPSSPLLLRGAPDYSTDTVSEFHAEAHRQLQVKDLPKIPTWRLERESNPRQSG